MRVSLFNANGLSGKAEAIQLYMTEHKIDLLIVVETHLQAKNSRLMNPVLTCTKTVITEGGRGSRGGISIFLAPKHDRAVVEPLIVDKEANYIIFEVQGLLIAAGYFPPDNAQMTQNLISFLEKTTELAEDKPYIALGDFNARMGLFSGDHSSNTRGNILKEWIIDSPARLAIPTTGKYTSFGGATGYGRGITDIVLAKQEAVLNYTVFESLTLGGSDHRPLLFDTRGPIDDVPKQFKRWNIRKFTDPEVREQYATYIADNMEDTLLQMEYADNINEQWELVKELVNQGAQASCGIFEFNSAMHLRRDFGTEELKAHQARVKQQEDLVDHLRRANWAHHGVRAMAIHELRTLRRETKRLKELHDNGRLLYADRRRELFEEMADELADPQNRGTFMRMVKTNKARNTREVCQLDPNELDAHAQYFRTTFGSDPGALHQDFYMDAHMDPIQEPEIREETVLKLASEMALGKAAGSDGIPGELIRYGGPCLARIFTALFNFIAAGDSIPEDWKVALIVPVFKNKGSPKEIKNYRPIALTSVPRRLYEKVLLLDLEEAQLLLHDCQGGFRHHRSTLDQAFVLNEIMVHNPGLHSIFLDFRAAYDLVDRRILWSKLERQFNTPSSTIRRLKALFDFNASKLIVRNKTSVAIPNLRGLLQGSSLSPLLFNFYINDLPQRLDHLPMVTTLGKRTNSLLFADDANIHAKTLGDLESLLSACEAWSVRNNMEFAPTKCVYLGPEQDQALELYQQILPREERFKYLGLWFSQEGIEEEQCILERTQKGKGVTELLASTGMNVTGWAYCASTAAYRAFIRPTFEYGLALMPGRNPKILDKTQASSFRRILGASRSDSGAAMALTLGVEPMKHRIQILNAGFALRLHDSNDKTIPAAIMWRNGLQGNNKDSLVFKTIRKNPYWRKFDKKNHLIWPLQRPQVFNKGGAMPSMQQGENPVQYRPALAGADTKKTLQEESMHNYNGSIALAIPVYDWKKMKTRTLLQRGKLISRRDRVTITRWRIGNVCKHQVCCKCRETLTRKHGCECSGAETYIKNRFPTLAATIEQGELSAIDVLLNYLDTSTNQSHHQMAAHAIGLVMTICRHLEQTRNHFWRPNNGTDIQEARWNPQREQHNVIVPAPAARPAFQRNVRHGRRPRQPRDPNII